MSMREQIADIIYDNVGCVAHPENAADAILDALPDMIAPLVWPVFSEGQLYRSASPIIYGESYSIRGGRLGWNAYYGERMISPSCGEHEQAQDAANTHHRAAIMAAFTEETT
jgi:hypothetical protein